MPRLDRVHVLFVDDNADTRDIAKICLEFEGAVVDVADSGEAALAKLATVQPDVIVTDMKMPGMSGDAFLAHLKASPALRGIPVIAVSGTHHDARVGGFAVCLLKPAEPAAIAAAIAQVVAPPTAP